MKRKMDCENCEEIKALEEENNNLKKRLGKHVALASLQPGIYRIHWTSGDHSIAAVGMDHAGNRWYAPTNWISGLPGFNWNFVERVDRVEI